MKKLVPLVFCFLLVPAVAHAEGPPSRWERAQDPNVGEDYKLHVGAERMFQKMSEARRFRSDLFDWYARDLRLSMEAWNAEQSDDVRLRFDFGRLLEEHGEHAHAIKVLKEALAMAPPDHPAAENAWWYLGIACGHTGQFECEQQSYNELLRLRTEDYERLTPMLNLSEVLMHQGRMKESIASYQETLRIVAQLQTSGSTVETTILARWGLAVAYDRGGDRPAAEREAKGAVEMAKGTGREMILHGNGVFFYPDYEVLYYDGLGAVARARAATSAHDAAIAWAEAERKFGQYVRGAETRKDGSDRFVGMAKTRQASCKSERERAEKRRVKEPPPPRDEEQSF